MKYVALLRGINVNGIKITNQNLIDCFNQLGLPHALPVLQTGNVIFDSDMNQTSLKRHIETGLKQQFNYDAFIVLLTSEELTHINQSYPYEKQSEMHNYIIFTSSSEIHDEIKHLAIERFESVSSTDSAIYWQVPKGETLTSQFGKAISSKKYKPFITTRNQNTVIKILNKIV